MRRARPVVAVLICVLMAGSGGVLAQDADSLRVQFNELLVDFIDQFVSEQVDADHFFERVNELNDEAFLEGLDEDETFYPSLILAYATCHRGDDADIEELRNEVIPRTLTELGRYGAVREASPKLQRNKVREQVLEDVGDCVMGHVGRLGDHYTAQEEGPARMGALIALQREEFWDVLGGLAEAGVVDAKGRSVDPPALDPTATPTPSARPTSTPTHTPVPTLTPTGTLPPTATPSPTATATPVPSWTPRPTSTSTPLPTIEITQLTVERPRRELLRFAFTVKQGLPPDAEVRAAVSKKDGTPIVSEGKVKLKDRGAGTHEFEETYTRYVRVDVGDEVTVKLTILGRTYEFTEPVRGSGR